MGYDIGICALQKVLDEASELKGLASSRLEDYEKARQHKRIIRRNSLMQRVVDLCMQVKVNGKFSTSVLEFYGASGVGKTWLLGLIRDEIEDKFKDKFSSVHYIDLEREIFSAAQKDNLPPGQYDKSQLDENALRTLLDLPPTSEDVSTPKVVLLDNTEWLSLCPDFKQRLEDVILPYVRAEKVLFVLAGRYMLRWKQFSIRYRLQQIEVLALTPKEAGELVGKYVEPDEKLTEKIYYNYTWGHTLATAEILKTIAEVGEEDLNHQAGPALEKAVSHFLTYLRKLPQDTSKDELCKLLVAGTNIRVFSAATFKDFYQQYYRENVQSIGGFQKAMRDLQLATLVTWSNEWGGYIVDQPVRYVISSWLRLNRTEVFRALHSSAQRMYEKQVQQHPMVFPFGTTECLYHGAWKAKADFEDVTAPLSEADGKEQLLSDFVRLVDTALMDVGVQWNAMDLLNELEHRIDQDEELTMLLPDDIIQEIKVHIERFRKRFS